MGKNLKKKITGNAIFKRSKFSKRSNAIFGIVFASIASYILYMTFAAPPANFTNTVYISNLTDAVNITFTPDGRMLILGRRGTIWVAQAGSSQVNATPFLQLPGGQVAADNERGLLGIALDPSFSTNGRYYLYYTEASTNRNRISRFTAVGDTTNTNTETLVWRSTDNTAIYHQGGSLAFGSDGFLYASVGDHLDSANAQNLTSYKGKILRMASDGTIPTDNPFYDGAGPNKDEIWARGFRNPFRTSFDSTSGRLYVGDVGEGSWEEVNVVTKGSNYGWPTCEGTCAAGGMTNPTYTYSHSVGTSITGGFVYRGTQFPVQHRGAYFFGDYGNRWIKYLTLDANGNSTGVNNFDPATGGNGTTANQGEPVAMTMGPDGSIYYIDIGNFAQTNSSKVRKITYTAANQAPVVVSSANPTSGQTAPLNVNFSTAGTTDPEGQTLSYSWNFGDSTTSTQANPSHTYNSRGTYTARVTVSDGTNSIQGDPITITVGRAPVPTLSSPANNMNFTAGQQINFSGSATDPDEGSLPCSALSWTVVFHHDAHIHPGPGPFTGCSGNFAPQSDHPWTGNTSYEVTLTATDSDGIRASTSVTINPQKVNVTLNTNPSGGTITVDGIPHTTPYTFDELIGFQHILDAVSPQVFNSNRYTFTSWSDGGSQSHNVTIPSSNQSYTATFQLDSSLPAGLRASYPFEEGTGTTSADYSGNGNTATLNNALWSPSGKYGNGLSFDDAMSAYVSVNDSNTLDLGNTGTMEAWVRLSTGGKWQGIFAKGNANSTNAHNYALEVTPGNVLECTVSNGTGNTSVSSSTLTTGQFYHVACTWDGSIVRIYINGVQDASGGQTVVPAGNTSPLYIGQYGGNSDRFDGTIDEAQIYNRALSLSEIQTDMNSAITQGQTDTAAPSVSLTAPNNGATVRGSSVSVTATASDNVAVSGVQFKLDGNNLGSEDTSSPYSTTWNSTTATNGFHTLTAVARDAAGNTATATSITVTVDNSAPTVSLTAPSNGATVSGSNVTVSANASDNVGVSGVQFRLDGGDLGTEDTSSPYSISWNTTTLSNGNHTLTAIARDAAGNNTTASNITVNVNNVVTPTPDVTAPSVPTSFSSPSKTTSSVSMSWNASTDPTVAGATTSGLAGYKVYRSTTGSNGTYTLLSTTTSTTHNDTGLNSNTPYSYKVTSYDNAGNESSQTAAVTVTTDAAAPPTKIGDVNNDDAVNIFDLSILLTNYGKSRSDSSPPACDLNNDNAVNIFDLSILLSHFGE